MKCQLISLLLLGSILAARAEYIWNGQDWVWKEDPAETSVSSSTNSGSDSEGSGSSDVYDDDDEDENDGWEQDYDQGSGSEDVPAKVNNKKKNRKNKNKNRDRDEVNNYGGWDNSRQPDDNYGWNSNSNPVEKETPNTYNTYNTHNPVQPDNSDDFYVEGPAQTPAEIPPRQTERYPNSDLNNNKNNNNDFNSYNRPVSKDQPASFFAQPGTLAAVFGGAVVGLLCAILCVMFVVYRMRKKDEGSYMACDSLSKRSQNNTSYSKQPREFFA